MQRLAEEPAGRRALRRGGACAAMRCQGRSEAIKPKMYSGLRVDRSIQKTSCGLFHLFSYPEAKQIKSKLFERMLCAKYILRIFEINVPDKACFCGIVVPLIVWHITSPKASKRSGLVLVGIQQHIKTTQ